jgi:hypothetical protein
MAGARASYRQGRIVWAYLRGSQTGKRETHPAVILTEDADIIQPEDFDPRRRQSDNIVHVVGVSTKHKQYKSPYILLPFTTAGHPVTKLKQECGAIIGWYHRIAIPDDVIGFGGDVPSSQLEQLLVAVRNDVVKRIGADLGRFQALLETLLPDE